jgi:hypothetical protein
MLAPQGSAAADGQDPVVVPTGSASVAARGCPSEASGAASPLDYTTAIEDAVVDHDAGRFADARAQFLRAHGLYPNARTLRGLGMVEFELRNYADSVRYLEAALSCAVRPLEPNLRDEARRLLARARAYVGELRVTVEPKTASIEVDGVRQADAPFTPLLLAMGEHRLAIHADGYLTHTRTVHVAGPTTHELHVVLERALADARLMQPEAAPSHAQSMRPIPRVPPAEPRTRLARKWWLWTAVGVVVAGGVTTAVMLARRERPDDGHVMTDHETLGTVLMTLGGSK